MPTPTRPDLLLALLLLAPLTGCVVYEDDGDSAEASGVMLSGEVTRTAELEHDGFGDLFIAVFDGNPILESPNALGFQLIPDLDLTDPEAVVLYEIASLEPGEADPFHVIAFFDDNDNATPPEPEPDRTDLVSMIGLAAPTVSIPSDDGATLDLVLNLGMPF